jgi:ligand-binding sensor domain-containing protein
MTLSLKTTIIILGISAIANYIHAGENIGLCELVFYDTVNSQIPRSWIYTINTDDSGRVWAGSYGGGLGIFNGNTWKVFTTDNSDLPSNKIFKIAFNHKNVAWIGTDSGLIKYDGTTWTVYTPQNSPLKGLNIRAIAFDRNDNIWSNDGGNGANVLMFLPENEGKSFTLGNPGYTICTISDILVDSNNTTWVGMVPCGLARIEGDSWKLFDKLNSIMQYNWVDKLELDSQGIIWVGQSLSFSSDINAGGLLSVTHDANNWSLNSPSQTGNASNNVKAIACDKRGFIWVSTDFGGIKDSIIDHHSISIFNKRHWLSFALGKDFFSKIADIQEISVDKNNNIWFATDSGIAMLKQDTSAIDALFANTSIKQEFKPIRQQKREMAFYDLLGRKCLKPVDIFKKTNGIILGFDNFRVKKIAVVK